MGCTRKLAKLHHRLDLHAIYTRKYSSELILTFSFCCCSKDSSLVNDNVQYVIFGLMYKMIKTMFLMKHEKNLDLI